MHKNFQKDLKGKTFKANKQAIIALKEHHQHEHMKLHLSQQAEHKAYDYPSVGANQRK